MIRKYIAILTLVCFSFSSTGQTIWHEIVSNTTQNLEAIDFVDDNPSIGYIGGDNIILKTIDFGETWTPIIVETVPNIWTFYNVTDIHFLNENHGFVASNNSHWETFDGGLNWVEYDEWSMCYAHSLYFLNESISFVGGSGCFEGHVIFRIQDGVGTQAIDPDDWADGAGSVLTINFKDDLLGLAGTMSGKILRTVDGGFNWDTIPNIANGMAITDFVFEENLIRATHENQNQFGVMVSEDDGLTWEYDNETATFFYPKMNAAHKNGIGATFLGGMEGNAQEFGVVFNNQGEFWSYDIVGQPIRDIDSHSDSTTFCVGLNGSIYCNVDPNVINSIDEIDGSSGLKIFPNPAQDYITIDGEIPSNAKYEIIDMAGRKVMEGFFGYQAIQSINIEKLSAGSYQMILFYEYQNETYSFQKD